MSDVTIKLDAAVVRRAIEAKVEPAVSRVLKKYDLEALVREELLKRPEKRADVNHFFMRYAMLASAFQSDAPLIEDMVRAAIHRHAKAFVERHLQSRRKELEAAFKKMVEGSGDKLAAMFLRSIDGALKENWQFELSSTVSPKEIEHSYD